MAPVYRVDIIYMLCSEIWGWGLFMRCAGDLFTGYWDWWESFRDDDVYTVWDIPQAQLIITILSSVT